MFSSVRVKPIYAHQTEAGRFQGRGGHKLDGGESGRLRFLSTGETRLDNARRAPDHPAPLEDGHTPGLVRRSERSPRRDDAIFHNLPRPAAKVDASKSSGDLSGARRAL